MESVALLGVALVVLSILWRVIRPGAGPLRPLELRLPNPKPVAKSSLAPAESAQWPLRCDRILLRIPVRVAGINVFGKPFAEEAFTLVVGRQSASIGLRNSPRSGDQVTITNLGTQRSSRFRVGESIQRLPGKLQEWAVESLDPAPDFWQIHFPEKGPKPSPPDNIKVMLECAGCQSREMAELSPAEFHSMIEQTVLRRDCSRCQTATEWKFGFIESDAEYAFIPSLVSETWRNSQPTQPEGRREERLIAMLRICLKHEDGRTEAMLTENVSESGLCCATSMEMQVGDTVILTGWAGRGASEADTPARIVWRGVLNEKGKTLYGMELCRPT